MYETLDALIPRVSATASMKLDCASEGRSVMTLLGSAGSLTLPTTSAGDTLAVDEGVGVTDEDAPGEIVCVAELVPVGVVVGDCVGVRRAEIVAMDIVDVFVGDGVEEAVEPSDGVCEGVDKVVKPPALHDTIVVPLLPTEQPDRICRSTTPTPLHAELLNIVSIAPVAVHATLP